MEVIRLGNWERLFPDGVSQDTYFWINRLILKYGGFVKIRVRPNDHESLRAALAQIER